MDQQLSKLGWQPEHKQERTQLTMKKQLLTQDLGRLTERLDEVNANRKSFINNIR